jgi:hypothetical protein
MADFALTFVGIIVYAGTRTHGLSDLPAGTAGTGRVHLRWVADRAGTGTTGRRVRRARVDGFFFQNRTLSVPVAGTRVPRVRVRGYSGTG